MLKNIGKSIFWVVLYFVASIIGTMGAIVGWAMLNMPSAEELENLDVMAVMMNVAVPGLIIAAIICIGVFLLYKLIRKHPLDIKTINAKRALFCVGLGLFFNCVISYLVMLVSLVLPEGIVNSLLESTDAVSTGTFWVLLIGTGILVPIMEEIIFRHGVHGVLSRSNTVVAYIVSSLLFGLIHGNLIQGCYAAVLGFVCAFLFEKGKNLWYPIIIHMTINTLSVFVSHFAQQGDIIMISAGVVGLAIIIFMLLKVDDVRSLFKKSNVADLKEAEAVATNTETDVKTAVTETKTENQD